MKARRYHPRQGVVQRTCYDLGISVGQGQWSKLINTATKQPIAELHYQLGDEYHLHDVEVTRHIKQARDQANVEVI